METNRDPLAGPTWVSLPHSCSKTAHGGHKNRPGRVYRLVMGSPVVEPFRHVLRPLLRWAWKPHLALFGGSELVNLRPPSTFAIVMSVILGPLVFVMLLPLILILVPAVLVVGVLAMLAASLQSEVTQPGPFYTALQLQD